MSFIHAIQFVKLGHFFVYMSVPVISFEWYVKVCLHTVGI